MEQSITLIKKLFVSAKGRVEQLEEQMKLLPKSCRSKKWSYNNQLLQHDLDEFQKNPSVVQEELDMLAEEMRVLRKRVELANLYHFQMEDFNNLKMEYDFMKVELLIYQKRSKRSQVEQWELYEEKIGEIIQEAFESY